VTAAERRGILEQIDAAVTAMDELFNNLLDISKLDALVLTPAVTDFPIAHLLKRTESTFAATARKNGLSFRIVSNGAWVRSDPILLEADSAESGVQCSRQYGQRRDRDWLPPARRAVAHTGVGQRARHSGGSAPEHLRGVSSTRRPPA
jgi:hypothetical protein